jgi:hypothetical protein
LTHPALLRQTYSREHQQWFNHPGPNTTPARTRTGQPDRLSNALIEHVKARTDNTLSSIEREDLKKLMLSCLSGEAADLFLLLSAKDWNKSRPCIHNNFAQTILANKDTMKVVNLMTLKIR